MIFKKLYIPNVTPEQILHIFGNSEKEEFRKVALNDVKKALNVLACRIQPMGCSELISYNGMDHNLKKLIPCPLKADHLLLLASTIGDVPEKLKSKYKDDMHKSLMIDIAASELAEQTIFSLMKINKNFYSKNFYFVSPKLSPGYGDLDLTLNYSISKLMNTKESINMEVGKNGHIFPEKSVIALMFLQKK